VLGVICKTEQVPDVEEFFQLFKTHWDRRREIQFSTLRKASPNGSFARIALHDSRRPAIHQEFSDGEGPPYDKLFIIAPTRVAGSIIVLRYHFGASRSDKRKLGCCKLQVGS
jgi:hypothetical protein